MLNKHLTTNDILQCNGSPIDNNLMPEYVGQLCIDITNELTYIAKTLDKNGWITSTSGGEIDISSKQDKTDNSLSTTNKTITGAINELKAEVDQIDISNKQDITDNSLNTTDKTISGAINELKTKVDETFQEVDSGKTLIAAAIDNPSITKFSTFIAMSKAIANLKNPTGSELDAADILYNMMIEDGYNEANNEMTADELIDLLDRSDISVSDIKQIACGCYHTFILKNDGSIWACGLNDKGQLGLNDTTDRTSFTKVTANINNDVKQIACGSYFTFIIKNDGSVWACGANNEGQLGLGNTSTYVTFTKVTTNINNNVKQIACGREHTFIIKNDGSLWGCGYNGTGQLGLGNSNTRKTFLQVTKNINNDVKQVACGQYHSFILKNDGSVWCCGFSDKGQLGLGIAYNSTTTENTFTQVTANINNDVKQIACGYDYTFLLKNDGSLWATGYNYNGELGLGDTSARTSFTKVTTNVNNDVKQIACGDYFTYILKTNGSLWSCGYNNNGQLGLGDYGSSANKTTFTQVTKTINNDVKEVACGGYHTFIMKNDGSVWSCGSGNKGQLGLSISGTYITFTDTEFSTGLSEYDIDRLALYNYLLLNEVPVTENMNIDAMLELLVILHGGSGDGSSGSTSTGGIDVVCAASLPETVVENQIVIITSNEPLVKEMRDYSNSTPTSNEEIIIGISTTNNNGAMVPYSVTINNTVLTLYLSIAKGKFNDTIDTYDGYIGRNGRWIQFSVRGHILYFNGYDTIGFTTDNWSLSSNMYISSTSPALEFKMKAYNGGWLDEYAYFKDYIDLTNVRQVRIVGSYTNNGGNTSAGVGFVKSSSFGMTHPEWEIEINLTGTVTEVITDVSSLKGNYFFGTVNRSASSAKNALKIKEFELIY